MRSARLLICLLLVGGGVGAAALLLPRAVASLHALTVPTLTRPVTPGSPRPSHSKREHRVRRGAHTPRHPAVGDRPDHGPSRAHVKRPTVKAAAINRRGARFSLLTLICIELCAGVLMVLAAALLLVARRTSRRRSRTYALYELHLSTHDQAKAQDLEDMVESIANIVRAWPADRARHGQPYLALELICSTVARRRGQPRDGVVDQHPLRADSSDRARRRDQRRLPGHQARPRARRNAATHAPGRCASPDT